ncbi:MAG TPA: 2'-5' RNA ligase family protein [Hanamia sp.]|nr:2'-5' RNA ligase family protein [Hanamia sp.]
MKMEFPSPHSVSPKIYEPDLHKYLLVAHPDSEVSNKVMEEKQSFYDAYKEKAAINIKPHITVSSFLAKESMEDTLIRWIQRICGQQKSFTATLNNYSGFPPHTIYLRVQEELPFQKLTKDLKIINTYISSCACPPMKIISKPHVSIAGSLSEDIYFKALIQYSHKSFHESFVVNKLHLIKKEHPYDAGKSINIFGLPPDSNALFN